MICCPYVRCLIIASLALMSVYSSTPAKGQSSPTLETGWQNRSASDFLDAAAPLMDAQPGPSPGHRREVVQHAWTRFLSNPAFVSEADWATVERMLMVFGPRQSKLAVASDTESLNGVRQRLASELASVQQLVQARLAEDPTLISGATFQELRGTAAALRAAGFSDRERADKFAQWMDTNDWRGLPLEDQVGLVRELSADRLDSNAFSARWTGSIRAPRSGDYTFTQVRRYNADGVLKLWVDEELVLDSSAAALPQRPASTSSRYGRLSDTPEFTSQAVSLSAGVPTSFRVDYAYDAERMQRHARYAERRHPMVVLAWNNADGGGELVPVDAFSPPDGYGQDAGSGLKGEYFSDTAWNDRLADRLDPGPQLIWHAMPVLGEFEDRQDLIRAAIWSELDDATRLAVIPSEERASFMEAQYSDAASTFTRATRRRQMAAQLIDQETLLEQTSVSALREVLEASHFLPGDDHVQLLAAWGEARQVRPAQIGYYPGWGGNYYRSMNYDPLGSLGHIFWGPFWDDGQNLITNYLEKENGECNLGVTQVVAFAARLQGEHAFLKQRIDDVLTDEAVTGDIRMTWLLGRAHVAEVTIESLPNPQFGVKWVQEAFLAAQSNEYRFWALQELVARWISLDQSRLALNFLDDVGDAFNAPGQQDAIEEWRKRATALADHYAAQRPIQAAAAAAARRTGYIAEINRRLNRARQAGNTNAAQRYQRILTNYGATPGSE